MLAQHAVTPPGGNTSPVAPTQSPPSLLTKIGHGIGDAALGLMETGAHLPPEPILAPPTSSITPAEVAKTGGDAASNLITSREKDWQAKRAAGGDTGFEWARMGGQALGAAPLMALAPEAAPGVLGGLGEGALSGAIATAAQPVGDAEEGYTAAKLKQLGMNTGLGGLFGHFLGSFGKNGAPGTSNDYRDAVNFLRDRNVQPTIGQNIGPNAAAREDMLSTINFNVPGAQRRALETFNNGALNEALTPLQMTYTGKPGRQGMKAVADVFDKAYDGIKSQISLPVTDQLRTNIGQIVSDAATPDASIAKATQNILDKTLYNQIDENGVLSGAAFKKAESDLGKYAQRYTGEGATATERGIGEAIHNIQGALRDSLEDANPHVAENLRAINRGYGILARVQKAVPTNDPDGLVTPFSLARSVRAADNTVRDRAYTEGDALLQKYSDAGLRVLGNKFPNSGTAGRMLSADPFAWPFQLGASVAMMPFYGKTGTNLIGGGINALANGAPLVGSAARGLQQISPYLTPALLSAPHGGGLVGGE